MIIIIMLVPTFTKIPLQTNLKNSQYKITNKFGQKKLEKFMYKNNIETIIKFVNNCKYK